MTPPYLSCGTPAKVLWRVAKPEPNSWLASPVDLMVEKGGKNPQVKRWICDAAGYGRSVAEATPGTLQHIGSSFFKSAKVGAFCIFASLVFLKFCGILVYRFTGFERANHLKEWGAKPSA